MWLFFIYFIYLFIELPENMLYCDCVIQIFNDLFGLECFGRIAQPDPT